MRVPYSVGHDEIDLASQKSLQILFQTEIGIERIRYLCGELDQQVDVTTARIEPLAHP